jgi:hypothetical protein
MHYFGTFFDKNYLSRGIVLYNSLNKQYFEFTLFVLCLDNFIENYFDANKLQFSNIKTIKLADLEAADASLLIAKQNRKTVEYYFTLSPCLPIYLLKKFNLPHICTLDADIKFYNNPSSLFNFLDDFSIIITPHKFSPEIIDLEVYGKYNVSFQIFKNNEIGLQCLQSWRVKCLDWCKDILDEENNRFADQRYLDTWPNDFINQVKILDDNCSGLAPWNINKYKISIKNKCFFSENEPLIYYHYQYFKNVSKNIAITGFDGYKAKSSKEVKALYLDYWSSIGKVNKKLRFKKDLSLRINLTQKLIPKILEEKKVFFKFGNLIFEIDIDKIPKLLLRIIRKYG